MSMHKTESAPTAPTAPQVSWNELVFACLHQGQTTVWTGWKRAISAFNDPQMWTDPKAWQACLTRRSDSAWGFEGYGLVAVDMDGKQIFSVNDFSSPEQLFLPSTSLILSADDPSTSAFRALLSTPKAWPDVTLELFPPPSLLDGAQTALLPGKRKSKREKNEVVQLGELINEGMTLEQRVRALTAQQGVITTPAGKARMVMSAQYKPSGWEVHNDRGQEEPQFTMSLLERMRSAGFSAPCWSSIAQRVDRVSDDVEEDDLLALNARVQALKVEWSGGASQPAKRAARKP